MDTDYPCLSVFICGSKFAGVRGEASRGEFFVRDDRRLDGS